MRPGDIPVEPDRDDARRWVLDELSRPEYREAEPTWFDRMAQAVGDWIAGLIGGSAGLPPAALGAIVVALVVALLVVGLLVFGVPRLRRRDRGGPAPLFDDGDTRDLATLRRAADAAEAAGLLDLAIEERFRAVVRALADREVVHPAPGMTAHAFARAGGVGFPAFAERLEDAAVAFDGVRYLGRPGTAGEATSLADLDRALETATPMHATMPGPATTAGAVR
ncbi:DUF4129 domain-containing protein [Agromyces sp. LHK192]|uniref:DUF4129 domain-containing protein n=1 Tax=Agromyces sp. LHK192 TaxID=2498704 RepID=UPI000FDBB5FF|nr:DUF4129 domain-containing protein [Agromyces sp. LHK192]